MQKIIIVGAGGFGREVAWVIDRINQRQEYYQVRGFCDDDPSKENDLSDTSLFLGAVDQVINGDLKCGFICAIGNNKLRRSLTDKFISVGFTPCSIIDPSAVIAHDAKVGGGSFVGINSVISVRSQVGTGCIVNHNVSVGHDVTVPDYAQLCPGVSVSGECRIGEGALLGSNSCTIPCKAMGDWSVLGVGGVLISDLEEGGSRVRIR